MKKALLSLFFLVSITSYSQTWSPPGAIWHYTFWDPFGGMGYIKLSYLSDTIINSQNVKKLEKFHSSYNGQTNQFNSSILGYEYTYEDNGIVYLWFNNNWDTLYNFNASIGESWRMAKQPYVQVCDSNSTLTVTETGTVIINGISLKYLVLDFNYGGFNQLTYSDTILEKIGFKHSYMFPYEYCNSALDAVEGGPFRCYSDNNFSLYQPSYPQNCDFIVGIDDEINFNKLSVYPNPVTSAIKIENHSGFTHYQYKIFCTTGTLIREGKLSDEINVSDLTKGIYFLKLFNAKGEKNLKFVKQ